jgi:cobalt-zinc-cadmium resistance protein CzcA
MSNGVSAEIQRPLASVIVGGLVTATLLTLFVLPVLYAWFSKAKIKELRGYLIKLKGNASYPFL